jgi:hypothetical protein
MVKAQASITQILGQMKKEQAKDKSNKNESLKESEQLEAAVAAAHVKSSNRRWRTSLCNIPQFQVLLL